VDVTAYLEVIEVMKSRDSTVESLLAKLNEVYRTTTDNELRAFLFEVRAILESRVLDRKMRIVLPLDRSPYNALISYCQRRGA
jgi:hypothetical protein